MKLTNTARYVKGRLCHEYEFEGRSVLVCDSMRNVLLIIEMFADEQMPEEHKAQLLPLMLFADAESALDASEDPTALIAHILWEACGLDVLSDHESEKQLFDWDEDADRIKSSLQMAYGLDWDTACNDRSFKDICSLLGMLLETQQSTPFGEALHYRTAKPPEGNKYNQKERETFFALRSHFALKGADGGNADREATAIFDRIWKEVENG